MLGSRCLTCSVSIIQMHVLVRTDRIVILSHQSFHSTLLVILNDSTMAWHWCAGSGYFRLPDTIDFDQGDCPGATFRPMSIIAQAYTLLRVIPDYTCYVGTITNVQDCDPDIRDIKYAGRCDPFSLFQSSIFPRCEPVHLHSQHVQRMTTSAAFLTLNVVKSVSHFGSLFCCPD